MQLPGQHVLEEEQLTSEADPSKGYPVEQAVVEAAEPMSNAMHRGEEVHRASETLSLMCAVAWTKFA